MKILIMGGTVFLGRYIAENAIARGHEITLFNRGIHFPELFPDVEKIKGDRINDIGLLAGRAWDAVIDTSAYFPRAVRLLGETLGPGIGHYTMVSSISVYSDVSKPGLDESGAVGTLEDPGVEEITGETYGPLKALCEQAAEDIAPGRALNVRAGLIVGPCDFSDRFTYWPRRVAHGGEMLAPENPDIPTQFIDVRDLAEWIVRMVEQGTAGTFNATGPDYPMTIGQVLDASSQVTGVHPTITWMDDAFLLEQEVGPWMELPLWLPSSDESSVGFNYVDCSKAFGAGLTFRPLQDTIRATLEWAATLPPDREPRAGMSAEREAEVLARWHERTSG